MRISELAARTGVNVQTVRYYERRGLMPDPPRTASGYRTYDEADLARLRFIRLAQEAGFPLRLVGDLLPLRDERATCTEVGALAQKALAELDARIADLTARRARLTSLMGECGPTCVITGPS